MYVLLRSVRPQRRYRRTQRQPWHLRSALPPALWGQCPGGGRPSSEPEGRQPLPLPTGAGGHGGGVPEAGGAHEAAGVRGGHHLHLPAAAGRKAPPHPRGTAAAGAGLQPQRLHRRILSGPEGAADVRHPAGECPGAQGAVCPGPDTVRKRGSPDGGGGHGLRLPGRRAGAPDGAGRGSAGGGDRPRAGDRPKPGADGGGAAGPSEKRPAAPPSAAGRYA